MALHNRNITAKAFYISSIVIYMAHVIRAGLFAPFFFLICYDSIRNFF